MSSLAAADCPSPRSTASNNPLGSDYDGNAVVETSDSGIDRIVANASAVANTGTVMINATNNKSNCDGSSPSCTINHSSTAVAKMQSLLLHALPSLPLQRQQSTGSSINALSTITNNATLVVASSSYQEQQSRDHHQKKKQSEEAEERAFAPEDTDLFDDDTGFSSSVWDNTKQAEEEHQDGANTVSIPANTKAETTMTAGTGDSTIDNNNDFFDRAINNNSEECFGQLHHQQGLDSTNCGVDDADVLCAKYLNQLSSVEHEHILQDIRGVATTAASSATMDDDSFLGSLLTKLRLELKNELQDMKNKNNKNTVAPEAGAANDPSQEVSNLQAQLKQLQQELDQMQQKKQNKEPVVEHQKPMHQANQNFKYNNFSVPFGCGRVFNNNYITTTGNNNSNDDDTNYRGNVFKIDHPTIRKTSKVFGMSSALSIPNGLFSDNKINATTFKSTMKEQAQRDATLLHPSSDAIAYEQALAQCHQRRREEGRRTSDSSTFRYSALLGDQGCQQLQAHHNKRYIDVESDKFLLSFLKCDRSLFFRRGQEDSSEQQQQLRKAACRIMDYFEEKKLLFGLDLLTTALQLQDLDHDTKQCLESGHIQLLAGRDRAGRAVIVKTKKILPPTFDDHSFLRAFWFLSSVALEEAETITKGVVFVYYAIGAAPTKSSISDNLSVSDYLNQRRQRIGHWGKVLRTIPFHVASIHWCVNNFHAKKAATSSALMMLDSNNTNNNEMSSLSSSSADLFARIRCHVGSDTEVQYNLRSFGIPTDLLPVSMMNGTVNLHHNRDFLSQRKKSEAATLLNKAISLLGEPLINNNDIFSLPVVRSDVGTTDDDPVTPSVPPMGNNNRDPPVDNTRSLFPTPMNDANPTNVQQQQLPLPPQQQKPQQESLVLEQQLRQLQQQQQQLQEFFMSNNNNRGGARNAHINNDNDNLQLNNIMFSLATNNSSSSHNTNLNASNINNSGNDPIQDELSSVLSMNLQQLNGYRQQQEHQQQQRKMNSMLNMGAMSMSMQQQQQTQGRCQPVPQLSMLQQQPQQQRHQQFNVLADAVGSKTILDNKRKKRKIAVTGFDRSPVSVPGELDILLGRGRGAQNHVGNIHYRQVVETFRKRYEDMPQKGAKTQLIREVVAVIYDNGGRFLKQDGQDRWIPVNPEIARDKVSHSFRNQKRLSAAAAASSAALAGVEATVAAALVGIEETGDDDLNNGDHDAFSI